MVVWGFVIYFVLIWRYLLSKDGDSLLRPSLFHVRFSKLDTVRIVTFLIRRRVRLSLLFGRVLQGKGVLLKDIRWRIGKGNLRNVSNDPWINDGENFYVDTAPLEGCETMQVCYLIHSNEGYDAKRILAMPLSRFPIDNSYIWQFTTNDRYSVKSGYQVALWNQSLPPKIKEYLWRLLRGFIPCNNNLLTRGSILYIDPICLRCCQANKDLKHILFQYCPFTTIV